LSVLSEVFHFHSLTIDDCLNTFVDPPKVDDYGDYLFLITQASIFPPAPGRSPPPNSTCSSAQSYVVSFHQRRSPPLMRPHALRAGRRVPARGADWLAHALLDALVDHLLQWSGNG